MKKIILLFVFIGIIAAGFVGVQAYLKVKQVKTQLKIADNQYESGDYEKAIQSYDKANLIFKTSRANRGIERSKNKLAEENIDISGVELHFSFDSNSFKDLSGNNHRSALQGASWTSGGRFGGGLEFSGNVDYVMLDFGPLKKYTASLWVKPTGEQGEHGRLFESDDHLDVAIGGPERTIRISPQGQIGEWIDTNASLNDNAWNHIMLLSDGQALEIYLNGKRVFVVQEPTILKLNKLGAHSSDPHNDSFIGVLDELVILNQPLSFKQLQNFIDQQGRLKM